MKVLIGCAVALAAGVLAGALIFGGSPGPAVQAARPNKVDIGFSQDMVVHHQQAVDMSRLVRGKAGPAVSAMARTIEAAQLVEIGRMQGWLEAWDAPLVASEPMSWMPHAGHGSSGAAMGMASTRDLQRLQSLRGKPLDVRYLQLMIRHHQGAVRMAKAAAEQAGQPYVRAFARSVVTGQSQEIAAMTRTLQALGGRPLTGG